MKKTKKLLVILFILIAFLFLNNTNLFSKSDKEQAWLLAHRGLGQTFPMEDIQADTCTAKIIHEPEHFYIENTLPSMKAAFEAGADVVEFDIQPTADEEIAIFHDWTLECRTNGKGTTREYTMDELKKLDVGYGYTADNGNTYPFRGKGVGLMPTLDEVLTQFPNKAFLINIKSNDPEEGRLIAKYLSKYPEARLKNLSAYGGDLPIAELKEQLPDLRVMSKQTMKNCLLPYLAVGWTGYVPSSCKNTQLHLPEKYAPYLWGYPNKLVKRMNNANTKVILVAGNGGWSEGFDQKQDLSRIPEKFTGGIWTNRIDIISPEVKR